MSEFTCADGHIMASGDIYCRMILEDGSICGAPLSRMDGKSNAQVRAEEKWWEEQEWQERQDKRLEEEEEDGK